MTIDCVVIGAGIIGMMTAKKISEAGYKVLVLDKNQVGQESSWAGGGLLLPVYPWDTAEDIWPMISLGQKAYPVLCQELHEETGIDPECLVTGMLHFDQLDIEKVEYWSEKTNSDYYHLDTKQIKEIDPTIEQNSALYLPDASQVRNPRLLKAIKKSLLLNGVEIREGVEVKGINENGGRLSSVVTNKGEINCGSAVIAAGAWSGKFLKDQASIEPVRGQMLLVDAPQGFLNRILLKDGVYLIPREDGKILIGSTLEYVGFEKGTTEDAKRTLHQAAMEIIPSIIDFPIAHHWSGLRPGSDRGIPIIREDEDVKGLFINAGHFRNGVALAPASCSMLAEKLLSQL